jgi:hypothetical protein
MSKQFVHYSMDQPVTASRVTSDEPYGIHSSARKEKQTEHRTVVRARCAERPAAQYEYMWK